MTRAVASGRASSKPTEAPPEQSKGLGYFRASEMPLASLLFVIPMIVVYEVGTRWYTDPVSGTEQRIVAFNLLRQFLAAFGAHVQYLPCLTIVSLLMGVHIFRKDPWVVQPSTLMGMAVESILLAFPLLLAGQVLMQYLQHLTILAGLSGEARQMVIISFGAGVYEEAIFRLGGFALLSMIFRDAMRLKPNTAVLLIVVCSSLLFSLYHYLGYETFEWPSFLFRTFAGIYFASVYLIRGFGITAGAHAVYDIIVSCLR